MLRVSVHGLGCIGNLCAALFLEQPKPKVMGIKRLIFVACGDFRFVLRDLKHVVVKYRVIYEPYSKLIHKFIQFMVCLTV